MGLTLFFFVLWSLHSSGRSRKTSRSFTPSYGRGSVFEDRYVSGFCNNPAGLWVIGLDWGEAAVFVQRFCDQQTCDEIFLSTRHGGEGLLF